MSSSTNSGLPLVFATICFITSTGKSRSPVTLDTTRYDAIGADTPTLSALAKSARVFTQAYTAVPQTLASHGSMLTGLVYLRPEKVSFLSMLNLVDRPLWSLDEAETRPSKEVLNEIMQQLM